MSYKKLDIFITATELFYQVHPLSLELPKYELYELGSQLRRSADSVGTNIVEGYGRRNYKYDFVRFLTYSHSSCDETLYHLEKIKNIYPLFEDKLLPLSEDYRRLSVKIHKFIEYVREHWQTLER